MSSLDWWARKIDDGYVHYDNQWYQVVGLDTKTGDIDHDAWPEEIESELLIRGASVHRGKGDSSTIEIPYHPSLLIWPEDEWKQADAGYLFASRGLTRAQWRLAAVAQDYDTRLLQPNSLAPSRFSTWLGAKTPEYSQPQAFLDWSTPSLVFSKYLAASEMDASGTERRVYHGLRHIASLVRNQTHHLFICRSDFKPTQEMKPWIMSEPQPLPKRPTAKERDLIKTAWDGADPIQAAQKYYSGGKIKKRRGAVRSPFDGPVRFGPEIREMDTDSPEIGIYDVNISVDFPLRHSWTLLRPDEYTGRIAQTVMSKQLGLGEEENLVIIPRRPSRRGRPGLIIFITARPGSERLTWTRTLNYYMPGGRDSLDNDTLMRWGIPTNIREDAVKLYNHYYQHFADVGE